MTIKSNAISQVRTRRIEKLLAAPTNRILDERVVKRLLCVLLVAGSYVYLAGLLIPFSNKDLLHIKNAFGAGGLPWWMFAAFFLLRSSMRRITSLPDQYLDEREIELRDSSFKLGYLVVRRIGLASSAVVVSATAVTSLAYFFTPQSYAYNPNHEPSWAEVAYKAVNEFIVDVLGEAPIMTIGALIILLTFVAYSFPLIFLAWRDSKTKREPVVVEAREVKIPLLSEQFAKTSKRYFKLLIAVAISLPSSFIFVGLMFVLPIFGLVSVAVYAFGPGVFLWAEIKLIEAILKLKIAGLNLPRRLQLTRLASGAAVSGGLVPAAFLAMTINNELAAGGFWIAIAGGLAAVGFHVAAFISLRLTSVELASRETTSA